MAPSFNTYFSFSEFNGGRPASLDEFRAELSQFSAPEVVYLCSVMNSVITDWQGHYRRDAHEELVRNSFAPEFAARIIAEGRNPGIPRSVYHRRQLLFVAKEAILCCPKGGGKNPLVPPHSGAMGRVLLMANDLLPKGLTRGGSRTQTAAQLINVMSELIPIGEASGHFRAINKIVRSRIMLDRFLPSDGTEVKNIFERETGVPLDQYFALCFATLCRYYDLDLKKYQSDTSTYALLEQWYKTIPVSSTVLARFLAEISASLDDFRCQLQGQEPGSTDFTCFRSKPIFLHEEGRYLIDSLCLAEKSESGIFWRVNQGLPQGSRLQFHRDWGAAFERYVNWIIGASCETSVNRIYPNPTFSDTGSEVCDALLVCGDSMLFVESKGTTFSARSKYGTDPAVCARSLKRSSSRRRAQERGLVSLRPGSRKRFARRNAVP